MAEEQKLFCMDLEGFWMDVGQPKDFLAGTNLYLAHLEEKKPEMLTKGEGFISPVLVDKSAIIGRDCVIGPNVTVGPNCMIHDGVRIKNSVILEGVEIGGNSWISQSIVGWKSVIGKWSRIQNVSVLGQDVTVADELFINGGSVLPHKSLSESVPEPKIIM